MKKAYYFTASWCGPCKKTRPLVEKLNTTGISTKFNIVDVDEEPEMAEDFGIRSIPTFIVIQDGVEIKRMVGSKTAIELESFINE